jgi:hypothetical protein
MITERSSLNQASSNQSNSNNLNSNDLNSNQSSQIQVDKQIEHNIDETCLVEKKRNENQSISFNETDTIDLSTSSQRLETELINRKRKTEEECQNALKKKYNLIKISTLILSVDEALKNAQKILFKDLKVAKTEHVIIQQLINQIERARTNLYLTDETSIIIDQIQTTKSFEFASINLTKKSDKSTPYCETIFENFQQLEKAMKQKITKLINKQLKHQTIRSRSDETIEKLKSKSTSKSISKEKFETSKRILVAKSLNHLKNLVHTLT